MTAPAAGALIVFARAPRPGRVKTRLAATLGSRLNATWSMWSTKDFERWWRSRGQWAAHLKRDL